MAEFISFLAEVLQKGIEGYRDVLLRLQQKAVDGLQPYQQGIPLTTSDFLEILSVQWQLIAIGLGAMLGSFVVTPEQERDSNALLRAYTGASVAILVILLIYTFWPSIFPAWLRVVLTDAIGGVVIYLCVRAATNVRKP